MQELLKDLHTSLLRVTNPTNKNLTCNICLQVCHKAVQPFYVNCLLKGTKPKLSSAKVKVKLDRVCMYCEAQARTAYFFIETIQAATEVDILCQDLLRYEDWEIIQNWPRTHRVAVGMKRRRRLAATDVLKIDCLPTGSQKKSCYATENIKESENPVEFETILIEDEEILPDKPSNATVSNTNVAISNQTTLQNAVLPPQTSNYKIIYITDTNGTLNPVLLDVSSGQSLGTVEPNPIQQDKNATISPKVTQQNKNNAIIEPVIMHITNTGVENENESNVGNVVYVEACPTGTMFKDGLKNIQISNISSNATIEMKDFCIQNAKNSEDYSIENAKTSGNYSIQNAKTNLDYSLLNNKNNTMCKVRSVNEINDLGDTVKRKRKQDDGEKKGEEDKRPCLVLNGARIDWEDKIPMDVITFVDATDPNAMKLLGTDTFEATNTTQDSVIVNEKKETLNSTNSTNKDDKSNSLNRKKSSKIRVDVGTDMCIDLTACDSEKTDKTDHFTEKTGKKDHFTEKTGTKLSWKWKK